MIRSNIYLFRTVESHPLVDVVLAVDDPEYLVVGVDDAARVVSLLPHDRGVGQVQLVMPRQSGPETWHFRYVGNRRYFL